MKALVLGGRGQEVEQAIDKLRDACGSCPVPEAVRADLCRICATQQLLRGKWKLLLIWFLRDRAKRFNQLLTEIPGVKHGPLTAHLKELTESGLVNRKSFDEVPPHVEYSLTEKGRSFFEMLRMMDDWAREHLSD